MIEEEKDIYIVYFKFIYLFIMFFVNKVVIKLDWIRFSYIEY